MLPLQIVHCTLLTQMEAYRKQILVPFAAIRQITFKRKTHLNSSISVENLHFLSEGLDAVYTSIARVNLNQGCTTFLLLPVALRLL